MDNIQGFAERFSIDYKRNICFGGTLSDGNHVDTASAECTKQFSGNTRNTFHIIANNSNGCQILL